MDTQPSNFICVLYLQGNFEYVIFVGFHAQRNFCDKQNVLFFGTPLPRTSVFCARKTFQKSIFAS